MVTKKPCTKCSEVKTLENFYTSQSTKTGYSSKCRACVVAESRAYRESNKEKFRLMMLHKINKVKAGQIALAKLGHLKENCSVINCDKNGRVEFHHFDYTHPLEVIPLCEYHHKKLHTNIWQMDKQYGEEVIEEVQKE